MYKRQTDTFVLDFVNSPEDIKEAFQPFYQATVLEEETDPNRIYDLKNYLDKSVVYTQEQIDNVADIYFKSGEQDKSAIGKMRSILDSSVKIYSDLKREDQDKFLSALESFVSFYGFITQICRMYDKDLLKFAIFAKFLLKVIPVSYTHLDVYKRQGIEWIGDIPEDWEVKKLKYVAEVDPTISEFLGDNDIVSFAPMECLGEQTLSP